MGDARMVMEGVALNRIDGPAKVTGAADYAADINLPGTTFGVVVQSGVANARIVSIDIDLALSSPGIIRVWTHANLPKLKKVSAFPLGAAWQSRPPMHDDVVRYSGQAIAFVVAETLEAAMAAAALIRPEYAEIHLPRASLADGQPVRQAKLGLKARLMSEDTIRGDVDKVIGDAAVVVDAQYATPRHLHMAMEPSATVAWWEGEDLVVREGTQWVDGAQDVFATWFGIKRKRVRILSAFVGGGFGLRIGLPPEAALPAMASREIGRPVKMVLDREQVCLASSGRPATSQHVRLAANRDGRLLAMVHDTTNETDRQNVFNEPGSRASKSAYGVANYRAEHSVVQLDIAPPAWMRAPGEAPGSFAVECAMDELAVATRIDPVELRLRNFAKVEPSTGKPWSSNRLVQAYAAGAQAFGWSRRNPRPGTRRDGNEFVGVGMAMANYSGKQAPSEARLRLERDGTVVLESRAVDIGTGAYTALALAAAQALGIPATKVDVRLGDTEHARSAFAGGSMMTASVGEAVHGAANGLIERIVALARSGVGSPFRGSRRKHLLVTQGRIGAVDGSGPVLTFAELLDATGTDSIVADYRTYPSLPSRLLGPKSFTSMAGIKGPASGKKVLHSFGAHFVEVGVDADTGTVRVRRMVGAFDCGWVINPKTARSQLLGGMVMGLGMALSESVHVDRRLARPMNANLGEYLVPVHADIPRMEVIFVGEFDEAGGPLGGKPVGELGITGAAAAIANAVFNATGRRVRTLPIQV